MDKDHNKNKDQPEVLPALLEVSEESHVDLNTMLTSTTVPQTQSDSSESPRSFKSSPSDSGVSSTGLISGHGTLERERLETAKDDLPCSLKLESELDNNKENISRSSENERKTEKNEVHFSNKTNEMNGQAAFDEIQNKTNSLNESNLQKIEKNSSSSKIKQAKLEIEENKSDEISTVKGESSLSSKMAESKPGKKESINKEGSENATSTVADSSSKFEVTHVESPEKSPDISPDRHTNQNVETGSFSTMRHAPSLNSEGQNSNSNASFRSSINQDTIGPLDNPAFLHKFYASVSQQPLNNPQFVDDVATSNLDIDKFTKPSGSPDIDEGYAWVILGAAVVALALLGASCFVAGVLLQATLENIDPDLTKVCWVGAVYVATMCIFGPFVGVILERLGCRLTVMLGGLLMCLGFLGASFSNNVLELILSHGLTAGIGSGLMLNTAFVTVGQRFNRLRGIACGLLATGVGAGYVLGGILISQLLEAYGLRGAYLLWSGLQLHIVVCGMLMRPMKRPSLTPSKSMLGQGKLLSDQDLPSHNGSVMSGINSIFSAAEQESLMSGRTSHPALHAKNLMLQRHHSRLSRGELNSPLLRTVLHRETSNSIYSISTAHQSQRSLAKSVHRSPSMLRRLRLGPSEPSTVVSTPAANETAIPLIASDDTSGVKNEKYDKSPSSASHSEPGKTSSDGEESPTKIPKSSSLQADGISPSHPEGNKGSPSDPNENFDAESTYTSRFKNAAQSMRRRLLSTSSYAPSARSHLTRTARGIEYDRESLASTLVSNLQPRDALTPRYRLGSRSITSIMGSVMSIPTALAIVKDDLARIEETTPTTKKETTLITSKEGPFRIFKNKPFTMFILASFIFAFGDSPVTMYLPSYAVGLGTGVLKPSTLYTAMGFGSMTGRFLSGLIASDGNIGPVLLFIGCLSIAGVLVTLCSLIMATLHGQILLSLMYGVYTGALVPLLSLITIELLGIEELGLGFGFLSMFQGVGYLIGPPLAGIIVQEAGYEITFLFAGFTLVSGSVVGMIIAVLLHKSAPFDDDNSEADRDSFIELEKALRRISDSIGSSDEEDDFEDGNADATHVRSPRNSIRRLSTREGEPQKLSPHEGHHAFNTHSEEVMATSPHTGGGVLEFHEDTLEPISEEIERRSMDGLEY